MCRAQPALFINYKTNEHFVTKLQLLWLTDTSLGPDSTIGHSRKYHNIPLCFLIVAPKFCISIVVSFSWELKWPQEKLKTMLMQNFGVTNKEHYGMLWYFWSGQ